MSFKKSILRTFSTAAVAIAATALPTQDVEAQQRNRTNNSFGVTVYDYANPSFDNVSVRAQTGIFGEILPTVQPWAGAEYIRGEIDSTFILYLGLRSQLSLGPVFVAPSLGVGYASSKSLNFTEKFPFRFRPQIGIGYEFNQNGSHVEVNYSEYARSLFGEPEPGKRGVGINAKFPMPKLFG